MRVIRGFGIALAGVLGLLVVVGIVARFSDGPIAIFPGGPLVAGELHSGPEPDWTFARDIGEMDLQLLDPPRSRTLWVIVHEAKLFLVSGYMRSAVGGIWKKWPHEVEHDPRAVVRVAGVRYERTLVRQHDPALLEPLAAEVSRKYGVSMTADYITAGNAWVYAVLPRSSEN
jgi:hypothetical protein